MQRFASSAARVALRRAPVRLPSRTTGMVFQQRPLTTSSTSNNQGRSVSLPAACGAVLLAAGLSAGMVVAGTTHWGAPRREVMDPQPVPLSYLFSGDGRGDPAAAASVSSPSPATAPHANVKGGPHDFLADAAERAMPSLVNIRSSVDTVWGSRGQTSGSGFVVEPGNIIVTNAHVVSQSDRVTVTLSDGRALEGRVKARDTQSDIAIVAVDKTLPAIEIGTSGDLRPGQWVVALGSPLTLSNTVTAGIVSSAARHSSEIGLSQARTDYIQTDAAINVGNSGGPLVDLDGKVIGINTIKAAGVGGISFAIPIDTAWQVVRQLRERGSVARPYVGLKMGMARIALPEKQKQQGVLVVQVNRGSPAEKAGIKPGDVVVAFAGKAVASTRDVLDGLGVGAVGKEIPISILRQRSEGDDDAGAAGGNSTAAAAKAMRGGGRGRVGGRPGAGGGSRSGAGSGFAFGDADKWESVELTVVPTALPQ